MGERHKWTFKARFRRHSFGWKSQPAIKRVKEAVSEIKKVRRKDPLLAAEGAVVFLERVSPALEQVDGSSGAIGTAVNRAIDQLIPIISKADIDTSTRQEWLDRLFDALQEDQMPYIERLADAWGDLCVTEEIASDWADRLLPITQQVLGPDRIPGGYFSGTSACLSALLKARRFQELIEFASGNDISWHYKKWAVEAMAAQGQHEQALRIAESSRGPWASDREIDALGEQILLSMGRSEEAYRRYGLPANRAGTYLASFRAVAKRYPNMAKEDILADLVAATPGQEGKWFAAAKSVGLYQQAIDLARQSPCDPKTLIRAARDYGEKLPSFAVGAGLLALYWMAQGHGYEITSADVSRAYDSTIAAGKRLGDFKGVEAQIREIAEADNSPGQFVSRILARTANASNGVAGPAPIS